MRFGAGTANTGAFWSFGPSGSGDRALGSVGSTTIANQPPGDNRVVRAARFTNNTGIVLTDVTVNYVGEQWRDGGDPSLAPNAAVRLQPRRTAPQTRHLYPHPALDFVSLATPTPARAMRQWQ